MRTRVYCDGACKQGFGGWGVFIAYPDGRQSSYSGHSQVPTTNNRMELSAVIAALARLPPYMRLLIILDSEYVLNGILEHILRWKVNGWLTADSKPVKNRDLWETLDGLCLGRDIQWGWTKGHRNDPGNVEADRLAGAARKVAEAL